MTRQELDETITALAIKHGAFVIDNHLCGDGMDVLGFAKEVIQYTLDYQHMDVLL